MNQDYKLSKWRTSTVHILSGIKQDQDELVNVRYPFFQLMIFLNHDLLIPLFLKIDNIIFMDINIQGQRYQLRNQQSNTICRGKQEQIFSHQIEKDLRTDFQSFINESSYIQVPCFNSTQHLQSFDHDHQIISQDHTIQTTFPTKQSKQEHQGSLEKFDERGIDKNQQDIKAKIKCFEDELIAEMKHLHPYFSEKQLQQTEQNVVQFWQSHEVKPSSVGKILKQCVKTLLLYQAYHKSNLNALQKKGILQDIKQKYATLLNFMVETFDNENEKLDSIIPLQKEYFIFRHLNFESFPDHQFHITQQTKKVRSKKKKHEKLLPNAAIKSQSNGQKIASLSKHLKQT